MKKSIIFTAIAVIAINFAAFAQTPEEWKASDERVAEMQKLEKAPKASKIASLDGLVTDLKNTTMSAIQITEALKSLQQSPDLATAMALANGIAKEVTALADAAKKMEPIGNEVKAIKNPMQIAGATSGVNYCSKVLQLVGEESVFHGKAIAALIASLKGE